MTSKLESAKNQTLAKKENLRKTSAGRPNRKRNQGRGHVRRLADFNRLERLKYFMPPALPEVHDFRGPYFDWFHT
jgi:hypothetical protein